jgi:hypothetical protein
MLETIHETVLNAMVERLAQSLLKLLNRITSFLLKQVAELEASGGEKSMRLGPRGLRIRSGINSRVSPPFPFWAVGASQTEISKSPCFGFIFLYLGILWE